MFTGTLCQKLGYFYGRIGEFAMLYNSGYNKKIIEVSKQTFAQSADDILHLRTTRRFDADTLHALTRLREVRNAGLVTIENISAYYRAKITWGSCAIEGNTATEAQTEAILKNGLTVSGSSVSPREVRELIDHAQAWDQMLHILQSGDIFENDLVELHHVIEPDLQDLYASSRYRECPAYSSGKTRYCYPESRLVPRLCSDFFDIDSSVRKTLFPTELAAWRHWNYVRIHPFADGNGRLARLFMNFTLMQGGLLPVRTEPSIRDAYIDSLRDNTIGPFLHLIHNLETQEIENFCLFMQRQKSSMLHSGKTAGRNVF